MKLLECATATPAILQPVVNQASVHVAFGSSNWGWNLSRLHVIDFFTFFVCYPVFSKFYWSSVESN
jgi:hypothetical protein